MASRPRLEALEDRTLLSAYVVTTTADSGAGSLRDAINQVNADTSHALYASPSNPNVDEIDFNITAASDAAGGGTAYNATTGVATIEPQIALAPITNAVILNGYSQPGASPNTLVVGDNAVLKIDLDGSQAGSVNGLVIGNNSTVEGLAVTNFGHGQDVNTAPSAIEAGSNNQIIGDFIGTDVTGTVTEGNGYGIAVFGNGNTIGGTDPAMRNVIGGNSLYGVTLFGSGNVIEGSYIGTDHSGTKALGNGGRGVANAGSNNTIGGSASGAGNVISGNGQYGIEAGGDVVIQGNYIGLDATGTLGLGNGTAGDGRESGIRIDPGAGSAKIVGNVISANPLGIESDSSVVVQGNLIGTDATGTTTTGTDGKSLGNTLAMYDNAPTLIGGPTAADRNVISGNGDGIDVNSGDVIEGNYIGTDITGTHALGNAGSSSNPGGNAGGIDIQGTATTLTVVGNLISGNGIGMNIRGGDGSGCIIQGNLIGTDYTGTQPLGNATGIAFYADSNYTIGGLTPGAGNVISGNGYGINMFDYNPPEQTGNVIEGNFIGTNAAGATNLGNGTGVYLESGYSGTEIGGTTAAAANVIADNGGSGILCDGSVGNVIQGNSIIGNGDNGIYLVESLNNLVGGTTSGAGNTIASNGAAGIEVGQGGFGPTTGNSFLGNSIDDNGGPGIRLFNSISNDNQTAPVLTTAGSSSDSTTVSGTLVSVANTTFRIEFFSNADLDASGTTAEGLTYLGFTTVTTDSNGNASFTATNLAPIPVGQGYLTATATNQSIGDTSQFSNYLTAPTSTVLTSSAATPLLNQQVTFTATVSSSFGMPTGSVDFVDTTTNTDLGSVAVVNGMATLSTSALAVGSHTIVATYSGEGSFLSSQGCTTLTVLAPSSLSGIVYEDFNDNGQVDFGEQGISGVTITLTGTDDLGNSVSQTQLTDSSGAYVFLNLRPGNYYLTETQPAGYVQGIDTVGTAGGSLAATDQFSVALGQGVNGLNYNYGEQPPAGGGVGSGQTAGIGFWNNKNGQALIQSFNGGSTSTQLGDWLAATLPHMFGANAGSNDLAGASNAAIAALFQSDFVLKGVKLDAEVLATALSVYATNATLDNTDVAANYGFTVSGNGLGTATANVGSNGAAFGVANNNVMTVLDLLKATDAQAVGGLLYNGDAILRKEANNVYSAINEQGDIG